jgi:protein-disulfide isomerase
LWAPDVIIGLGGYFIRPAVSPLLSKATLTPTTSAEASAGETNANQPGLKDYVVAQTHHFLGDSNAPVTVIEFGDFQ